MTTRQHLIAARQPVAAALLSLATTLMVLGGLVEVADGYRAEARIAAAQPSDGAVQQVVIVGRRAAQG